MISFIYSFFVGVIFNSPLHFVSFVSLILAMIIYCLYMGSELGTDTRNRDGAIN